MKGIAHWMVWGLLICCLCGAAEAGSSRRHRSQRESQTGQPGVFDYYVLALSWSPEFCYSHRDKPECQSGHHGFVVHGLWPQYTNGYPENCSTAAGLADPSKMADLMPDPSLVDHEWKTHGTCSGLDAEAYFKLLRQAFSQIHIPAKMAEPSQEFSITPSQVKDDFLQANRGLAREDITVSCGNNYLTAVSVCMTKSLEPKSCEAMRDCRANSIKVPPVR